MCQEALSLILVLMPPRSLMARTVFVGLAEMKVLVLGSEAVSE